MFPSTAAASLCAAAESIVARAAEGNFGFVPAAEMLSAEIVD